MKNTKKGFTIVELVIVIAIIAILAAVLIPTFSNVISKANETAVQQAAKTKFEEVYALDYADGTIDAKQGTEEIAMTGDFADCTYDGATFTYTDTTKKLTATFTIASNTWNISASETSAVTTA